MIDTKVNLVEDGLTAVEFIKDGIAVFNEALRPVFFDPSVQRMLGLSVAAANESPERIVSRIQVSGAIPLQEVLEKAFKEGEWRGEAAGLTGDDHAIHLELVALRLSADAESGGGVILFMRNLTRDRLMEQRVMQSQQMELVDKLSRGIGHELKNITTIIMAYASLLDMNIQDPDMKDAISKISETATRVTDLTRRLTSVTRRPQQEFENVDLSEVVHEVNALISKSLPSQATLVLPEARRLPVVFVDPGALIRSIIHLTLNACESMPNGGTLTLGVDTVDVEEGDVANHPAKVPGHYAVMSVTDTGAGMTPDVRDRLFEPFYSTKENGSGLGLLSVRRAIESMNGWIRVYSEPNQGTCARLYLPTVRSKPDGQRGTVASLAQQSRAETVMMVDDDVAISNAARLMLERSGYRVLTAGGAKEAIALLKNEPQDVDVVVLDVVMPEVNGDELYQRLHEIREDLPIIIASGFPESTIRRIMGDLDNPCITKPFTQNSLLGAIGMMLGHAEV